jgi:hypothetical protein
MPYSAAHRYHDYTPNGEPYSKDPVNGAGLPDTDSKQAKQRDVPFRFPAHRHESDVPVAGGRDVPRRSGDVRGGPEREGRPDGPAAAEEEIKLLNAALDHVEAALDKFEAAVDAAMERFPAPAQAR